MKLVKNKEGHVSLELTQQERIALYTALSFYHDEAVRHLHRRLNDLNAASETLKAAKLEEYNITLTTVNSYQQGMYNMDISFEDDKSICRSDTRVLLKLMQRLESYSAKELVYDGWKVYLDILNLMSQEWLA